MEHAKRLFQGFPAWSQEPIPGMSFSAAGLLALADLSTIAQRTAIAGGSSWLDSLLLAPGLHYQQAADELARGSPVTGGAVKAVETDADGRVVTHVINNAATVAYIQRVAVPGQVVTVDVGMLPKTTARRGFTRGQHAGVFGAQDAAPDLGWFSHLMYLISPVLTVVALVFLVLLQDWWGLGFLSALMFSRVLNIWVIKQRATPLPKPKLPPQPSPPPKPRPNPRIPSSSHHQYQHPPYHRRTYASSTTTTSSTADAHPTPRLTSLLITLSDGRAVALRGMSDDLAAITADAWLQAKTHVQGYLEAAAKLVVYLVAALSGNQTQVGSIVLGGLLLLTAGLLALSNANAKGLRMKGRVAAEYHPGEGEGKGRRKGDVAYPVDDGSRPGSEVSGDVGIDDWAEKGQVGGRVRGSSYPFEEGVEYE